MSVRHAEELRYPRVEAVIDALADWWHQAVDHHGPTPARPRARHAWSEDELSELAHEMSVTEPQLKLVLHAYPELSDLMARRKGLLALRRKLEAKLEADALPPCCRGTNAAERMH